MRPSENLGSSRPRIGRQPDLHLVGTSSPTDETAPSDSKLATSLPDNLEDAERYAAGLPLHLCNGCDGCGMRCTEGIRMTRREFLRVEQFLLDHPEEARRVQSQEKGIPGWPVTQFCQFRDTELNRCSIYPVRPVICRFFGHTEWLPCPLEIVPLRGQEAMDVYQRYAGEAVRTFEDWRQAGAGPLVEDEQTGA